LQYTSKSVSDLIYDLLYDMKNQNYFSRRQSQVWQRYLNPHSSCILHTLTFWLEKKNTQTFISDKLSTSYTGRPIWDNMVKAEQLDAQIQVIQEKPIYNDT